MRPVKVQMMVCALLSAKPKEAVMGLNMRSSSAFTWTIQANVRSSIQVSLWSNLIHFFRIECKVT